MSPRYGGFLTFLLLQKLAGREAEVFLERAGEVLGIFEAEEVGGLGDGLAVPGATVNHGLRSGHAAELPTLAYMLLSGLYTLERGDLFTAPYKSLEYRLKSEHILL